MSLNPKHQMSTAGPAPPDPETDEDEGLELDVEGLDDETVIFSFLEAFPNPTDEQVHKFATLLGYKDFVEFEEKIFKLFGDVVNDGELYDEDDLDSDDLDEDDEDAVLEELEIAGEGDNTDEDEDEDEDEDDDEEEDEDDEDDEEDDPIATFLISFFLLNPEPTEDEVHALAELVGLAPEVLEQKIYSILSDLSEDPDSDVGETDEDLVTDLSEGDDDEED